MDKRWVSKQMKKARGMAGISTQEMGQKLRVSTLALLRLEKGEVEPTHRQVLQWSRVTGYPLIFFIPDGWFDEEEIMHYDRQWDEYVQNRARAICLIIRGHLALCRDTLKGDVLDILIDELIKIRRECL